NVSRYNTRKDLSAGEEDSALEGLASSIREKGLLSLITVLDRRDGAYELIAGQRLFLACKKIGFSTIPAIVRENPD
ncbi:parB-like partition protein, partial [mine drainage metagenome]